MKDPTEGVKLLYFLASSNKIPDESHFHAIMNVI